MGTWTIYTYGNADTLYKILVSVGTYFGSPAVNSLTALAVAVGFMFVMLQVSGLVNGTNGKIPYSFQFFIKFAALLYLFVNIHVSDVVIFDEMTNKPQKEINTGGGIALPWGLIAIESFCSGITNSFINLYEEYFETGASSNPSLSYSKSGMAFGANFVANLPTMQSGDQDFEENLKSYFLNCGLPLAYAYGGLSNVAGSALNSTDLIGYFTNFYPDKQSQRFVQQNNAGTLSITTCKDAISKLNEKWESNRQQYLSHASHISGFPDLVTSNFIAAGDATANDILKMSEGASGALKQAIAMNMLYKSIKNGAIQTDNTSLANAVYDAQQFQQYQAGGVLSSEQAARVVPVIKAFVESAIFMLYPLMVFYALVTASFGVVSKYIKWSLSIAMIPLIYEIITTITYWVTMDKATGMLEGTGLNLMSSSGLYSFSATMASTANWLAMSAPLISYAIVSGSDMAITGLFSHATDPARSVSSSQGANLSTGNENMGNVSMDNAGMNTLNANKFNNAFDLTTGAGQLNKRLESGTNVSAYQAGNITMQTPVSSGVMTDTQSNQMTRQLNQDYGKSLAMQEQASKAMSQAYSSAGSYAEGHGQSWSGSHDRQSGVTVNEGSGVSGQNTTSDRGTIGGGFSGSVGSGGSVVSGSNSVKASAEHSNQTQHGYSFDSKNVSQDINSWKHSDLYKHDKTFQEKVDQLENTQYAYKEAVSKSEDLRERISTSEANSVSTNFNMNNDRVNSTHGSFAERDTMFNNPYNNAVSNKARDDSFGSQHVNSSLGVNQNSQDAFSNRANNQFSGTKSRSGNNSENKYQEVKNNNEVVQNSDEGINNASNMTQGNKIKTIDTSNAKKFNYTPQETIHKISDGKGGDIVKDASQDLKKITKEFLD